MLERIEIAIDKIIDRARYRLLSRIRPELGRLSDEKDQHWAVWFGYATAPLWERTAVSVVIFALGPIIATITLFALSAEVRWISTDASWPFLLLIGPPVGFFLAAVGVAMMGGSEYARRYYRAMRIFGDDVCPGCGYDMAGHELAGVRMRTCPECGGGVPPLKKHV